MIDRTSSLVGTISNRLGGRAAAARAARRVLLGIAAATLIVSVASGPFEPSVAMAERAPPPQARPVPTAPAPSAAAPDAARPKGLSGKLNLNTATAGELELLPGVGPTKAVRVLEFRAKQGPFKRVFDLRRVKGFGKKTVDRLTPLLTVTEKTSLRAD